MRAATSPKGMPEPSLQLVPNGIRRYAIRMSSTKTLLVVLRHAHAVKARDAQPDYDRPLEDRGHVEAEEAGETLLDLGIRPARIVCSGSARTRETLAGLGTDFADVATVFDDRLYHEGKEAYLAAAAVAGGDGPVMLVGHNPSVAELIGFLAGDGDAAALRGLADGVSPGSFAVLEFRTPLGAIANGTGFLRHFFRPARR